MDLLMIGNMPMQPSHKNKHKQSMAITASALTETSTGKQWVGDTSQEGKEVETTSLFLRYGTQAR
jgi:hypothetical protein